MSDVRTVPLGHGMLCVLVAVFGPVMEGLRGKDYGRSEFEQDYSESLSAGAVKIGYATTTVREPCER